MSKRTCFRAAAAFLLLSPCFAAAPLFADLSHARIVRVSVVQGDARFARDVKGDPLTASGAGWETAVLNLPIRQGYVLATDNGRAGVEFENGAMAFLAENTVLEFYDLSLQDGARTTRLILRQGSAEFHANPERGEYFSVTGGDFSVEATARTTFRLNNFDDGSNVQVLQGRASVLSKGKTTPLEKGQSLSMQAGEAASASIGRTQGPDDFDKWVAGRIESVATATTSALQYTNVRGYTSGFADLYTYGSWFPVAGYGSCWRPFGAGFGWSPFDYGSWYFDPIFGWTFIGNQPWGWLPYHYGGWISDPGLGWCWNPAGAAYWGAGHRTAWRPVTAVWVRSRGVVGLVPAHPLDVKGRTPLNLGRGVFPVTRGGVSSQVLESSGENWKVEKKPPRDAVISQMQAAAPPARVFRSMIASPELHGAGTAQARGGQAGNEGDRSFRSMNGNVSPGRERAMAPPREAVSMRATRGSETGGAAPPASRVTPPPPRPVITPPPAPRAAPTGAVRENRGEGPRWGGSSGGASGGASSRGTTSAPAPPAPRPPSSGRPHD